MIIQVRYDTMYYHNVVGYSPQVPCKCKGQHIFSFLLFTGCYSGSNNGLGWASSLL